MHICIHAYIHTYIHIYMFHEKVHIYIYRQIDRQIHTYIINYNKIYVTLTSSSSWLLSASFLSGIISLLGFILPLCSSSKSCQNRYGTDSITYVCMYVCMYLNICSVIHAYVFVLYACKCLNTVFMYVCLYVCKHGQTIHLIKLRIYVLNFPVQNVQRGKLNRQRHQLYL